MLTVSFFSSPFFFLFFLFKRVCPLSSVLNAPPPPVCVPVSVLSLPVQCWSLSCGKQRRPFRLCAPTWLRQQVWRTFHFFSTPNPLPPCYRFLSLIWFFPPRGFPLDETGLGALADLDSNVASQFLRERNSLSGEEKPQVQSWSSGEELKMQRLFLLLKNNWIQKEFPFNLLMVTRLHLSCLPQEPIRPLEKRALNFLVNEYLLKNEYKLSSITFSDENDDQVNPSLCLWAFFS